MKILAADIGGTALKVGLVDEMGNITQFAEFPSEGKRGGQHIMNTLAKVIEQYSEFDAIGISTAGQVDSGSGSIIYANDNIPGYTGMPIKTLLEKRFSVPVKVENDVNAAALGERHFGSGRNHPDFLCLTYGTGIGGAIILGSQVYKGHNGVAAEFGHMLVHPGGKLCNCGRRGCYEMYASTTALVQSALEVDGQYQNGRLIAESLDKGDRKLEQVWVAWSQEVAYGLATLVHVFNPAAIIVGGGIMERNDFVALVNNQLRNLIMESFSNVEILKASLGNKAGVLGAASLHLIKKTGGEINGQG